MSEKNDTPRKHFLVSNEIIEANKLTPRQTSVVGAITLWIILAGLWKTVETAWVILAWLFR